MTVDLPAELAQVVACCRWPHSRERLASVRAAASRPIDWDAFERVVARHRVSGLVHDGLRTAEIAVPAAVHGRLAEAAMVSARAALVMANENLRLQHAFDEAGLPNLSVKGSSLALLAYGTLGIKQSHDIDLLTTPEHATPARRLLMKLGYGMSKAGDFDAARDFNDLEFARFAEISQEAGFFNPELNVQVDLHWRLDTNAALLTGLDALSGTQAVALGNRELRTLEDDALFAYLCVHGSRHGWARLKWLADLNAFLACRNSTETERIYRQSVEWKAGRPAAAALLLCRKLFGLALPDRLVGELRDDPLARRLMEDSLHCIAYRRGEAEFSRYTTAGMRVFLLHFYLASGPRYLRNELHLKLTHPVDAARIILPGGLTFLYYLLRLPMWVWRNGKRVIGSRAAR